MGGVVGELLSILVLTIKQAYKKDTVISYYDDGSSAKFFITGDKHRHFDRVKKFCREMNTRCKDVLIILGDAGFNYYDDSLFSTDFVFERLKGYYPFYMFNQLYKLDQAVEIERESDDVWAVAAKGNEQNVMVTYFQDDDGALEKTVKVEFKNVNNTNGVKLEYYCLDESHDCELVREEIFTSTDFAAYIKMPRNATYLLKIVQL